MRTLNQQEVAHVSGAAAAPIDTGLFPKTGIAFIDKIHANEWKNIYQPLLKAFGLIKK